MSKQVINRGSFLNDPTAETAYAAFGKVIANFDELYAVAPPLLSSVTASPAASQNNYAPAGFSATTTRLLLAAAAGGSTITGLLATGFADDARILVRNTSTTDSITFSHASGSSSAANRFSLSGAADAQLGPLTSALLVYVVNQWVFS